MSIKRRNHSEVYETLKEYEITKPTIRGISSGSGASVYSIRFGNKQYVLKCGKRERIETEARLLQQLNNYGAYVPIIHLTNRKRVVIHKGHQSYILLSKLIGRPPAYCLHYRTAKNIGATLAEVHNILFGRSKQTAYIHGDVTRENVKYGRNRAFLLDFGDARRGSRAEDCGIAIQQLCISRTSGIRWRAIEGFLDGYHARASNASWATADVYQFMLERCDALCRYGTRIGGREGRSIVLSARTRLLLTQRNKARLLAALTK